MDDPKIEYPNQHPLTLLVYHYYENPMDTVERNENCPSFISILYTSFSLSNSGNPKNIKIQTYWILLELQPLEEEVS